MRTSTELTQPSRDGIRNDNVVKPVTFVSVEKHDDGDYDLFGAGVPSAGADAVIKTVESTIPLEDESPTAFLLFPPLGDPPADFIKPSGAQMEEQGKEQEEEEDDHTHVLFPRAFEGDTSGFESEMQRVPPDSHSLSHSHSDSHYESDAAYAEALNQRLNGMALSPPPPPQFKNSGNAVDIIAAKSTDNMVFTTSWHVMFSWSRFRSNLYTGVGDTVRVLVNGKELPTKMQLLERGRCAFVTGGLTPPKTDLLQVELFEDRPNLVRFEHFQKSSETIRYVESRLHMWGANESVIVADLDGTLTVSDVEGHIRTLRLGQYDFLHKGACDFFEKLHELSMRIVYLTARPIDWATASRTHLENAKQHTRVLPPGPLITNSNGLTGALLTEVVNKNPHVFKANVLNEIQLTLIHAGRIVDHPVFVAGFGNRPTDSVAYEQVGISPELIFLIDPYSNLKATTDPRIYESYADPNALLWLLPKLKHKVPIEKVQRIDDYTVRELVLAEDREQLLIAEREARRLQEEEYERVVRRPSGTLPSRNSSPALGSTMYGGAYAR